MNENDMKERYIHEVVRRLPQDMREEISREIRSLIEDMCMEEEISTEEVLQKLGDPAEFAKRYNDTPNYLIGPEYYDNYMWVVKVALWGIVISAVVSAVVQGITGMESLSGLFKIICKEFFTTAVNGTYSMIGIVTIVFGVLEWHKVKVSIKPETSWSVEDLSKNMAAVKKWTPGMLPPVPDKRAVINRGDSVFSIIFLTVFAALLIFVPQVFGAFHYDGSKVESISCVFNLNEWSRILPLFVFVLFIGLVDEIIRLVTGYYCKTVMYSSIICNCIMITGNVIILKVLPVLNPDFAKHILQMRGRESFGNGDLLRYWGTDTFINIMLGFCILISCAEVGVAVYKTKKYS